MRKETTTTTAMKTSLKNVLLKRFLPYFVYLVSLNLLNVLNVLFIFNKRKESSLLRTHILPIQKVSSFSATGEQTSFTLRQPQIFETKHLQILQFYLRSLTVSLLVLWSSIVVTQSDLQLVTGLPVAQPSYKLGSVYPSGTNRSLACSARAQDLRVYVEQVSGLQQSIFQGARSDSKL